MIADNVLVSNNTYSFLQLKRTDFFNGFKFQWLGSWYLFKKESSSQSSCCWSYTYTFAWNDEFDNKGKERGRRKICLNQLRGQRISNKTSWLGSANARTNNDEIYAGEWKVGILIGWFNKERNRRQELIAKVIFTVVTCFVQGLVHLFVPLGLVVFVHFLLWERYLVCELIHRLINIHKMIDFLIFIVYKKNPQQTCVPISYDVKMKLVS